MPRTAPNLILMTALALLIVPHAATAAPTDPVSVVPAPEGVGASFVPGARLVADLPQDLRRGGVPRFRRGFALQLRAQSAARPDGHRVDPGRCSVYDPDDRPPPD